MIDSNKTPWNPSLFETECCWDLIYSRYQGEFCRCKCGKTFIDETQYISRHSGKLVYICKLNKEEEKSNGNSEM